MAYSQATLIQSIRHELLDTPPVDNITALYTAGGLTLTVADATIYDKGDILEFKSDGDTFVVNSASGTTITMLAAGLGWDGSTNANHSSGDAFFLRPSYRRVAIIEALEDTILDLWPYAFKVVTDTLTPAAGTKWYDAATSTTTAMEIVDAVQRDLNTPAGAVIYGGRRNPFKIRGPVKNLPTAVAASTVGYYLARLHNTTYTIAVRVKAKLTAATGGGNYSDLTGGLMTDVVVYGAVARLLENTEVPRVSQSDVTQGEATVRPGNRIADGAYYRNEYKRLRNRLREALEAEYPRLVT